MPNIYARSPYIVSINEASQVRTKIEIYMWKTGVSVPTTPQYTLSKYIPSSNNTETVYNISPFLREYIENTQPPTLLTISSSYINYKVKRYKDTGLGYEYINEITGYAFDGYTDFNNGVNYSNSDIVLKDESIYYYDPIDTSNKPFVYILCDGGSNVSYLKQTPLEGGGSPFTYDLSLSSTPIRYDGFQGANVNYKNKFEIYNDANSVVFTCYFYPITECRYTPIRIDYVNKYGAWDRFWFFKTSNNSITTSSKTYNTMQSNWDYDTKIGTTSVYNKTGREKIRLNSGFVEEAVNSQIRQIMLSEKILVDGKPAVLKTDSVELFKHINQKQINYTMEFEYAFDLVNNVL